jgi:sulfite exporter TauE/SafE
VITSELLASCGAIALASLLGSVHCAGMCGGLSACATPAGPLRGATPVELTTSIGRSRRIGSSLVGMQAAYHGARLVGYAALGAVAGTIGAALDLGGSMVGVQRVASIAAGATIAILGAVMLLRVAGARIPHVAMPGALARLFQSTHRRVTTWPPLTRSLAIGAVTPLLPCGWLYAFIAIAAGAGSALGGMALMVAFWLGTVPALVTVAVGARLLLSAGPIRRVAPILASLVMIAVGVHLAFVRGGKAAIVASSIQPVLHASEGGAPASADSIKQAVDEASEELPACCRGEAEP